MKSSGNGKRAPLRTLLQNFLNHVETMETKRSQGDDQYDREFQELKLLSESLKGVEAFSSKEGEKEVNRKKNRYKDILPFDYTRVVLSEFPGIPGSDYINANYIRGASGSNAYIASQGPLAHTVSDFWRMIVECEVQVVIMACNEEESGKHKCEFYWVDSENEPKKYGPYSVKLLKFRRHCSDFSIRTMELSYVTADGEPVTRTIVQFHYWAWPDHGVPNLVRPLLEMVRLIRDCQASETLPLLVHCSAGCGRTGTICAIDYVWGLLKTGKLSEDFRLFELVADMRRQRVAMVQTKDQYVLVHQAVKELFLDQLKMIDAHPYENLDVNGHPLICPAEDVRIDPSYETIFANCSDGVLEVREEDDNYLDSPSSLSVPWPVLQFQAELEKQQGELESSLQQRKGIIAPPLPDKKRKSSQTGATLSTYDNVTSSGTSSKESSPPNSLERADSTNSSTEKLEPETVKSKSASPSQNLVRRPSILKLRALFERSGSEPRSSEKRSKSASRKASSFRFNEAPRLQRAAESDPEANPKIPSASSGNPAGSYKEFYKPPKLSLAKSSLPADGESFSKADRPNLPVKRSKSMKVYRNFDVSVRNRSPEEVVIAPAPCDIFLSKTPSITYVSSKEVLHSPTPSTELLASPLENPPLATSSLDRTKEQKPKVTSPVCGSLDRGSQFAGQGKEIPTYVNILMKNQEISKLDDDTRQLLRDCQAYLMSSDGLPPVERSTAEAITQMARDAHQRLMAVGEPRKEKPNRDGPPCDRKESLKQALLSEPDPPHRTDGETKKKAHEYEAVWLGSPTSPCPPACEEINANSLVSKDSIFVQKSDEIRHLLNELRSSPAEEEQAVKTTPRLQPDRVLSELQQLVEESNRLHQEAGRKPAYVNYPQPPPREATKITSPLVVRKDISGGDGGGGGVAKPRETKTLPPPKHSPSSSLVIPPTQAPAFRPPPPYPANLVVKLPPLAAESDPLVRGTPNLESRRKLAAEPEAHPSAEASPKPPRRPPPEYKAPPDPPVKRPVQASPSVQSPPLAPVAPPRVKKAVSSTKSSPVGGAGGGAFPMGPPVPTRSYSSQQAAAASATAPGIDLDAVAAGMAATTTSGVPPPKSRNSPNPSAAANRALSKALGKFQATAASFKTKLAQLGSEEKSNSSASAPESTSAAAANPLPKMTRESSFVKSLGVYGNDAGVVNASEATTYVRKKQQYL